jgi:hypothetical protein
MTSVEPPALPLTVGGIAHAAGCPVHRVTYLLRARRIRPAFRAGTARVFTPEQVRHVLTELLAVEEARKAVSAPVARTDEPAGG